MAKKIPIPESAFADEPTSAPSVTNVSRETFGATRGLGFIADPVDERDYTAKQLLGAPRNLPGEASIEEHLRGIKDQRWTQSCVGQAIATAADTRLRKLGVVAPEPSSLGAYSIARSLGNFDKDAALQDGGSSPRLAMKGIREYGIPAESAWPFAPDEVNAKLPWDVLQSASAFRIVNWYRIEAQGTGRMLDVQHALAQGYPVIFGTEVDQAFQDHTGTGPVPARQGKSRGGHMLCIVGYRVEGGEVLTRVVNSWGDSWGDHGLCWASEAFIKSVDATDFYVMCVGG